MSELLTRRSLLTTGLAALLAAPAIVRAESLMNCKGVIVPPTKAVRIIPLTWQVHISDIDGLVTLRLLDQEGNVAGIANPQTNSITWEDAEEMAA